MEAEGALFPCTVDPFVERAGDVADLSDSCGDTIEGGFDDV